MTKTFDMHIFSGVIVLQVMFEGVVGSTAFSDIAIDDVEFQENTNCTTTAETLGKTTDKNEILISVVLFYNHYNTPIVSMFQHLFTLICQYNSRNPQILSNY